MVVITAGTVQLSPTFHKDLNWFRAYVQDSSGLYMIHEDTRPPIALFIDACATRAGTICGNQAYHTIFPTILLGEKHPICHLEAINVGAVLRTWAWWLKGCLVDLHTDNNTSAAIFQLGRGRDSYIQASAWELWLICVNADITLVVSLCQWNHSLKRWRHLAIFTRASPLRA